VLPYKDLIGALKDIEEFCKGSVGSVGRSNEEIIAEFLRGDGSLLASPPPSAMEGIDIPVIVADDNDASHDPNRSA
jgi:hypothetical protein